MYWIELLKVLWVRRGWEQRELAAALDVRWSHLEGVLSGRERPTLGLMARVTDMLGYDLARASLLWLLPARLAKFLEKRDLSRGKRYARAKADRVVEALFEALEAALRTTNERNLERLCLSYLRDEEHS